jgi:chaperonin GroES
VLFRSKKPQEGEVIAVGSGKVLDNGQRAPMQVKVGDTVIYSKYGGTEVEVDGVEYVVLDEDSILAVK